MGGDMHTNDCDAIVYRDGIHTCDCGAEETHPCGCPADTVTSVMRGWREQCSSCGAVFTSGADA